ncbi:L-2-amino-thiazoline-4-carboxylic acid hydrolase [Candidatus Aminicenantes bacterium AC-708-M15]|jgi:hypothetical protein|nr:L-2-amino-thiazoline-4-carboxylic acid hydrolase [SCandidatus Aminicenantes bacterium Aminicenantia_JdfR_composite]MCP2596486.1 L-2-amino-thiazoline-4-carboxylic acid hydrolase [Candidatus Aminicenantes bacterium AC-335-G13]MCP2598127.1 L-2-amino-thiazoline-4-carboxylic acid hydrolase [Candidatus Aminicenantes bacterium AC-335-L06]MCP2603882.1 L-2-amino-thiazoline-4-carboxylic acid hydrolase [Candidatus Aminicenantes bacterium AC-708-M15]MCP2606517.1 L-2-amino-thiazoline-4-carboxylic acid hy
MKEVNDLSKEELLELLSDYAKNWLAHDGLWFQEVEKEFGLETAIELDRRAWEKFTMIEAKRIMKRLNIEPGGGIPALIQALKFRLYAHINKQEIVKVSENRCIFRMITCRVQEARKRKNLPDFPCKPVGIVEYTYFAKTIDPRIKTVCIACPPDPHPSDYWCAWEFKIEE